MNKKKKTIFIVLTALTLLVFISAVLINVSKENNSDEKITLKDNETILDLYVDDESKALASIFIDKKIPEFAIRKDENTDFLKLENEPYILVFGITQCPSCLDLIEPLKSFIKENPELKSYTIYIDKKTSELEDFIKEHDYDTNYVFGYDSFVGSLDDFHIESVPTLFFINKDGIVNYVHFGDATQQQLNDLYQMTK